MKKLPFDLAKALAGAKLVTRDGLPATIITVDKGYPHDTAYPLYVDCGFRCAWIDKDGVPATGHAGDNPHDEVRIFLLDESDQPATDVTPVPPIPMVFPPWLTERKFYAAMALQGLLSHTENEEEKWKFEDYAEQAVFHADALIAELNKEPK